MVKYLMLLCLLFCTSCFSAPWWFWIGTDFISDYSANFDGNDEHILFSSHDQGSNAFSVVFWFKADTIVSNDTILSNYENIDKRGYRLSFSTSLGENNIVLYARSPGGAFSTYNTTDFSTGTWYHVILTVDGSGDASGIYWYVNNGSAEQNAGADTGDGDIGTSNDLKIGRLKWDAGTSYYYDGKLGDLAIIPKVVSESERTELYNGGSEFNYESFSYWSTMKASARSLWITWESDDLTSGTGSVTDLTDNAYSGTPTNTVSGDKVSDTP